MSYPYTTYIYGYQIDLNKLNTNQAWELFQLMDLPQDDITLDANPFTTLEQWGVLYDFMTTDDEHAHNKVSVFQLFSQQMDEPLYVLGIPINTLPEFPTSIAIKEFTPPTIPQDHPITKWAKVNLAVYPELHFVCGY